MSGLLMWLLLWIRQLNKDSERKPQPELGDASALIAHTLVASVSVVYQLCAFLLLLLPVDHVGPVSFCIYVGQGVVDTLILALGMSTSKRRGSCAASTAFVLAVASVRMVAVLDDESLSVTLSQHLFPFAPTRLAMFVNGIQGVFYLVVGIGLQLSQYWNVRRTSTQGQTWLLFLGISYAGSALGYVVLFPLHASERTILLVQWAAFLVYCLCFALSFRRVILQVQRTQHAALEGRLMAEAPACGEEGEPPRPPMHAPAGFASPLQRRTSTHRWRQLPRSVVRIYDDELEIHQLVGSGGFADVFRGTWHQRGVEDEARGAASVQVAVKQLHSTPEEPQTLRAFCKEIGLMQNLQHPNVVALLGACTTPDGNLGIVTEFLPRGSVFHLLHRSGSAPPLSLALRLLRGCADGMRYLHALDPPIIHRDLKSQNLLVAADFTAKVADFGLARECSHTAAMTRVGSVQWAAPEVLLGEGYSMKCDLWSFGVVCWELLTARVPFHGMSPITVASRVALEGMRLPVPSGAPRSLLRVMAKCWAEKPASRPDFDDIVRALSSIQEASGCASHRNASEANASHQAAVEAPSASHVSAV
uniref:Protein kinase domain-containing protein n=1 Tax=Chrysotila carterae TaxID=13221 RepID=A0A7S4C3N4_CHRCT